MKLSLLVGFRNGGVFIFSNGIRKNLIWLIFTTGFSVLPFGK